VFFKIAPAVFDTACLLPIYISPTTPYTPPTLSLSCRYEIRIPPALIQSRLHSMLTMEELIDPPPVPKEYMRSPPHRQRPRGAASGPAHTYENLYDSFEQFLLEAGEKKVETKLDTRTLLAQPYIFNT
jgi:hypothetical protein